jgi:polysaccharide export outer membrane protein
MIFTAFSVLILSCVGQSKVEYLRDNDKSTKAFNEAEFPDYTLRPNDELFLQINSLDEGAANVFSSMGVRSGNMSAIDPHLLSYSIDRSGYVLLPIIGKISVVGKTLSEVNLILQDSLNHILNQPVVNVKLVNSFISVLGEVRNPGHYPYTQDRLSIYDAIGLAGDITSYGNRDEVILIRSQDGKSYRINLNLTHADFLASNYYNLRPNDIVYVKPLKRRIWGMAEFPWSIILSTITTGLLIYTTIHTF